MPIKFYTDTHIAKAVTTQLRLRGVDIIRCEEIGKAEASDSDHMEYAASQGKTVVTNDSDFKVLHKSWLEMSKHHSGIFYITHRKNDIGMLVETLEFWHLAVNEGAADLENDIYDQLIYLP